MRPSGLYVLIVGQIPTELVPVLSDNYSYILSYADGKVAVVDPPVVDPILESVGDRQVTHILVTHHHRDHTTGILEMKAATAATVIGTNDPRVPGVDRVVSEGDVVQLAGFELGVMEFPGHTSSLIGFYNQLGHQLWCGDLVFGGGCGRLFDGTPDQMHASLERLGSMPDELLLYCGHEYTEENLAFAQHYDGGNAELLDRITRVRELRLRGVATVPLVLADERKTNPFLRTNVSAIRDVLGLQQSPDGVVFAALRKARDDYR